MNKERKRFSIGMKVNIFVIVTVLIATFGAAFLSYYINANQIDGYFRKLSVDSAKNFASLVDVEYMKKLRKVAESEEYQQIRQKAEEAEDEQMIADYLDGAGVWDGVARCLCRGIFAYRSRSVV